MKGFFRKLICAAAFAAASFLLPAMALGQSAAPVRPLYDLTGTGILPSPGFDVSSRSAYLIELGSGEVLFAKNANEDRYPASITKIMTAMVVLEHCALDEEVTFSHASVTDLEDGGFDARFKEGEVLTVEQCLYALMLDSVNSCGYALAEHVAGSIEGFAALMNEKAAAIGCTNSNFTNPHGLNDDKHRTTAHDMALIMWNALQNEDFYRIDSTVTYTIEPTEKNPSGYTFSMNHKMLHSDSEYYYDTAVAGKTGYTSLAFNTLVTYAKRDGAELIAVVMKETQGGGVRYSDTKKLLDYGFDKFQMTDISNLSQGFFTGLESVSPLPLSMDTGLRLYLPSETTNISFNFSSSDTMGLDEAVGSLQIKSGEYLAAGRALLVEGGLLKTASAAGTDTDVTPGESAAEPATDGETEPVSDAPRQDQESGSGFKTFLLAVMWVVIAAAAAVGLWWCAVRIIKRRRRRQREQLKLRRERIERMRALRREKSLENDDNEL